MWVACHYRISGFSMIAMHNPAIASINSLSILSAIIGLLAALLCLFLIFWLIFLLFLTLYWLGGWLLCLFGFFLFLFLFSFLLRLGWLTFLSFRRVKEFCSVIIDIESALL